jgi:hypothetical protein
MLGVAVGTSLYKETNLDAALAHVATSNAKTPNKVPLKKKSGAIFFFS